MRADICDAANEEAIAIFRAALRNLGAELAATNWAIGVDVYRVRIDGQELCIFSDAWSIDVDGPDDLVARLTDEIRKLAFAV